MTERNISEQLTKYLTDVHSIEVQAIEQLKAAPAIAGDEQLADAFAEHLEQTRAQERTVSGLLGERGADRSTLKDIAGRVGGWAMVAFARLNPDTPGKLVAHAFSYEHMEEAAYALLCRVAERAREERVVTAARTIGAQEGAMAGRLAARFELAVEASLKGKQGDELEDALMSYLRDAHAIEAQSLSLLQAGPAIAGCEQLADTLREHLAQTREHQELVEQRLRSHDSSPRRLQDAGMRLGGLNVGAFFAAQPDTPVKLAGFAYAFEHLEIAGYELLRLVAQRAGDQQTAAMAEHILPQERAAATKLAQSWDAAVDAVLGTVRVSA